MIRETTNKSVVIVGGGLSGLTAARQLLQENPDLDVTVLESMNRVGGRTKTVEINGFFFDQGAQFIGNTQSHVIALAQESGNQLVDLYHQGTKLIEVENKRFTYETDIPSNLSILGLIQLQITIWKINAMAKKVPTLDPKDCQLGYYWDSMSCQNWIDKNVCNARVKILFEAAVRTIFGADPCEMSFLFFLWYTHQSKDFDNLINSKNGLQQKKTKLGTQHFSKYLAGQIQKKGGKIKLGLKVKQIAQKNEKCFIQCYNQTTFECDYILMACAPWQANKIEYSPPLSTERKLICQRSFMGSYIKVILLYKKAYWREKHFSGQIITDGQDSPLLTAFDDTKINQKGEIQPALIVFVGGHLHRYWKSRGDLEKNLVRKIAELLEEPEMLHPLQVRWTAWEDEETIGGGPTGIFAPGVLTQVSDLRKPEGHIHWAGTQLATVSTGYMDGAIESGKRAASEISNKIKGKFLQLAKEEKCSRGYWYTKYLRGARRWFQWL